MRAVAMPRSARERVVSPRDRLRRAQPQVRREHFRRALVHRLADAVGEEADAGQRRDRDQRARRAAPRARPSASRATGPSSAKRSARIQPTSRPASSSIDAAAARRDLAVVRDQHERRAVRRVELEQELDDACAGRGVEVAGRLVGEQHRRARHEGARDRDALLLAARELARVVAEARLRGRPARSTARRLRARRRGRQARAAASRSRAPSATAPGGRTGTRSRRGARAPRRGRPRRARTAPCPRARREPAVGSSRPASSASSVDLPAPEAPTIATVSPASTARLTSSRMVSVPSGLVTSLRKLLASRTVFRVHASTY